MTDPTINEDFVDLLAALRAEKVEYVVVGAHALAAHGVPRATGDLDIFVRPSKANAKRVVRALHRFGAPIAAHGLGEADFVRADTVYQIGLPPRRIDLMTSISGVDFDEAWAERVEAKLGTEPAAIIGREALIKNKRSTGRDKDLLDVKLLERKKSR
jgi:hypothetical protein